MKDKKINCNSCNDCENCKKKHNFIKVKILITEEDCEAIEQLPEDLIGKIITSTLYSVNYDVARFDGINIQMYVKEEKN